MSFLARRTFQATSTSTSTMRLAQVAVSARRFASSEVPTTAELNPRDIAPQDKAKEIGQSPNRAQPWSRDQNPKDRAWDVSRMEQTYAEFQPDSLSAMKLVSEQPVVMVHARKAVCDGGGGPLGHPKIFINLDQPGTHTCGYCGARYEQEQHH